MSSIDNVHNLNSVHVYATFTVMLKGMHVNLAPGLPIHPV